VNLLAGAKTQSNPESCVGVLSLAGKVPKMLVTPTPDLGKVLNSMHGLEMDGAVNLSTGVQARKHTHTHTRATAQGFLFPALSRRLTELSCARAPVSAGGHAGAEAPAEQEPAAARGHLQRQPGGRR
jgi:hypothetical protein